MKRKLGEIKPAIRYSESFKIQVVRELESGGETFACLTRKYGIKAHSTIKTWLVKYGNGTRGKIIRVQHPQEINELQSLKKRVRQLEKALADANVDLSLERAFTRLACERAGIKDVAQFKKKAAGRAENMP